MSRIPPEIRDDLARAVRLEWWTIGWMTSIVIIMGLAMGSSQAMKSAWIEDMLGLVPAIVFLISVHFEKRGATRKFPFGFNRVNSLAFLVSATALVSMGAFLLYDSAMSLLRAEHPPIPPVRLFGDQVWLGWLMIAALIYSVIPPLILGRMKLPLARRLQDKVLHTDALMQKADWMTGLAGIFGIVGVGLGYWWADSVAAGIIAFEIAHDGVKALRMATNELIDGTPRAIDSDEIAEDALKVTRELEARFPGADVRLRETGRYFIAEIGGVDPPEAIDARELWPGEAERNWRLSEITFLPPQHERA